MAAVIVRIQTERVEDMERRQGFMDPARHPKLATYYGLPPHWKTKLAQMRPDTARTIFAMILESGDAS